MPCWKILLDRCHCELRGCCLIFLEVIKVFGVSYAQMLILQCPNLSLEASLFEDNWAFEGSKRLVKIRTNYVWHSIFLSM